MLKKIERSALFLAEQHELFSCPKCRHEMIQQEKSLICVNGHRFDLSKKGTLYFLDHQIKTDYDNQMFTPRGRMIRSGMYQPVIEKITQLIQTGNLLDIGCGEGSFLQQITQLKKNPVTIGFDIAKEGIYLASNQPIEAFWCVADLTNLPFADQSFDTILNIFSPSHYREFKRVLKPDGCVIKVVPQTGYLQELRAIYHPDGKAYSNEAVIQRFSEEMTIDQRERVTYEFEIPAENRLDLLEMSPLEWQVPAEVKANLAQDPLRKITIDVEILKGY
ncbi:methyltransferase domain-containing protein [Enterococcus xiangfangensis]|uniref:methyltransferase domain-containing protein n=1 Tax=Enterococcus xiangfangensis TaxID=1296537 RepID=UPI0010F90A88|nr:methyltransferase domain-containing protein [Enterococcus xiangfangensis]MBM7712470.1 23S rRNA (guanine745-N1)-methyltransferase [Enterococcus xiangfangensis]NBK09501.1 methyltransferase domain-containing protein [Enterococcus asini]